MKVTLTKFHERSENKTALGNELRTEKHTQMTKSSRSANTMQIRFRILWEIKIDDDVYRLDVNSTCE